jgi:hypothetical protein
MEQDILIKFERFVELSKKFTRTEKELFEDVDPKLLTLGTITMADVGAYGSMEFHIDGRPLYVDKDGFVKARDEEPITRAEKMMVKAEMLAQLSDEYDEYIELQQNLTEYFKSLNKLID